ncbi:helix-turn-helix domain-containing protein [Scandinavium lactucae]|uniref:Helix-turn-helix domain-containing protein n=1 Tax=Scandinavium lactucae TaxID=3095028 RepID=A0ABU4QNA2_9ENTR|nr:MULTISPECIES: helix-turn-helix domain-containing protein [unclassified Scandinavium]MDX6040774.1 helix-turn-helix domain-containing protein [Scandinavium sp. V105_6]MDX6051678.1 helix-turn-helix domain-containing protein [Scandinavium sp. V105_1]
MMVIVEILEAGKALIAVAPFLAGIHTPQQYEEALEFVEYLLLNDPTNPLLDIACSHVAAYEKTLPETADFIARMKAIPVGVAVLHTLINQHNLTLSDFPEIGSKSMVSRVLNGKRKLTLEHAKKLAKRFDISPAMFID